MKEQSRKNINSKCKILLVFNLGIDEIINEEY